MKMKKPKNALSAVAKGVTSHILVLEDDARRREAMQMCLSERFYQYQSVFFDSAQDMISFLQHHLLQAAVICLDHDLELQTAADGTLADRGTGREVADFLAHHAPSCPIVLHSTNTIAVQGMQMTLEEKGWQTYRVTPWDDLTWIPTQWYRAVRRAVVDSATPARIGK